VNRIGSLVERCRQRIERREKPTDRERLSLVDRPPNRNVSPNSPMESIATHPTVVPGERNHTDVVSLISS
jgi:hypothetical protein